MILGLIAGLVLRVCGKDRKTLSKASSLASILPACGYTYEVEKLKWRMEDGR